MARMAFMKMASKIRGKSSSRPFLRDFREFSYKLFVIATWVPVAIFFNGHVGEVTTIYGKSMFPYLNSTAGTPFVNDAVWVHKWYPAKNLQRGMIVTFWNPERPESTVIKRVIALEGDEVVTRAPYTIPKVRIPAGHVWVEGDNHLAKSSNDSNYYGPISTNLITGRVTHVIYPWSSAFGRVRWWEFAGKTRVIKRISNKP